ncbi:Outer membrane protein OprM precursor [compost metagenome]
MAQQSLQIAERLLQLVEVKARFGAATSLDLAQQRGLVAAQQRTLAAIQQQEAVARASLAVLSGHWNVQAPEQGSVLDLAVPQIQPGAPIELLTRRPDIARAEAQLQAAGANLQAARAAMLPRLSLSAGLGTEPESLRRLLDRPLLSLALGLTAPIFDAGRLASQRDAAVAQRQELLASYRQAIVAAYGDVQIALEASHGAQQQEQAQAQELAQARRALELAESRYRAGAETMLTLLETQRASFVAQDLAIQMRLERLQASVALYKALGGGWQLT